MFIINRPQTDPWFNIAAEEYLLKNMQEDCFMLWQNKPAVIVGKHQNAMAEINHRYVHENNVPVIRRISGGGTVFHDIGNLNFSFIQTGEREKLVDFRKFVHPVVNVLQSLGVPAKFEGKNDIRVNGLKISGNAEHVFKNKVLHHGTLLFASDLGNLNKAIQASEENFEDAAVKSVRSAVANISDFLDNDISLEEFKNKIIEYILLHSDDVHFYDLSANDIREIENLSIQKYKTWKWNYGYSPKFVMRKKIVFEGKIFEIKMAIKNGIIFETEIEPGNARLKPILHVLNGNELALESIKKIVHNTIFVNSIPERELQSLLESLVF